MSPEFTLKTIHAETIPRAVERAEHYRLLNEPVQAESICLDILRTEPDHERTLITLILAITDQFMRSESPPPSSKARQYVKRLKSDYRRAYYRGIIAEREGRAFLTRGQARAFAYAFFEDAMHFYEQAEAMRPAGDEDALLRWNSCARTIVQERLEPRHDTKAEQMLE